jgi:hypothetical protein
VHIKSPSPFFFFLSQILRKYKIRLWKCNLQILIFFQLSLWMTWSELFPTPSLVGASFLLLGSWLLPNLTGANEGQLDIQKRQRIDRQKGIRCVGCSSGDTQLSLFLFYIISLHLPCFFLSLFFKALLLCSSLKPCFQSLSLKPCF